MPLFKRLWYYFSLFFLARHYLNRDTRDILHRYKFDGKILDVGCGNKPYQEYFTECRQYEGIDFKGSYSVNVFTRGKPDYFFGKNYLHDFKLPFKDASYNHTVAFQVIEHHKHPQKLIDEIFRVTKKGGYIWLAMPFLWSIHLEPYDYQRFTEYGIVELLKNKKIKIMEILKQGSLFSTISMLINQALVDLMQKGKVYYIFAVIIYPPILLFQYMALALDKIIKSDRTYFSFFIIIKKL